MYDDLYDKVDKESWYELIPIIVLVSIVPLIVFGKLQRLTGDYYKYWRGSSASFDFFSYYKMEWIIAFSLLLFVIFITKFFQKKIVIHKEKLYIPMTIYTLLIILSTVFSDFKEISLFGFVERYEGMFVLLSYMVILFITINMINSEYKIKTILVILLASAIILALIGLGQYFNHDLFKTELGKRMILPAEFRAQSNKLQFQFGDKIIYGTLYHYNYVGSYMAMLFPLTFTMLLFIKNKFLKVCMGLISLLMLLNLMLSHSRAGVVGGIVAMIFLAVMIRKKLVAKWKYSLIAVGILIISLVGFNIYSKGMLINRIGSLFKDAKSMVTVNNNTVIRDITTNNNELNIVTNTGKLKVISTSGNFQFKDENDKPIKADINSQDGQVVFSDNKYSKYGIVINKDALSNNSFNIQVTINGSVIPLNVYNDRFTYTNKKKESVQLREIEKWGFEGRETLGSARAYIWSRSIPMLKHTILLGYGPDTFVTQFPQDDYVGKIIAYKDPNMHVDKAHNLYLENAINIGILGLIAFLAMFIMYFIDSFKLYFKNNFDDFYSIVGLAIFTAVCGYLGAGFFNDSVVSVAPVFWVLFGMGVSINFILNKKRMTNK